MKSYRIDTGDSNTGPAGFVAYVKADTRAQALAKLRDAIDVDGYTVEDGDEISVIVFLNADNVKIEEVEREDDTPEDEHGNEIADTPEGRAAP